MCILEGWLWWYLTLECNCRQPLNLIQPNDNDWKLSEKSKAASQCWFMLSQANCWGGDKTLHSAKLISAFLACFWNSQTKEFCHRLPWKRPVWQSARSCPGSGNWSVVNIYNLDNRRSTSEHVITWEKSSEHWDSEAGALPAAGWYSRGSMQIWLKWYSAGRGRWRCEGGRGHWRGWVVLALPSRFSSEKTLLMLQFYQQRGSKGQTLKV